MDTILIASRNKGKIREMREILHGVPYHFITLDELKFKQEILETGKTFEENAILKAKTVGEKTKILTLAEDSGLEVDALNGKPGIYSARYIEGTDKDRYKKVLEELKDVPKERRTARFKAIVALFYPKTKKIDIFEGVSEGYIAEGPKGTNGFGYDPIFYNLDLRKTNGEAYLEEKNRVSHRARALQKLRAWFQSNGDLFRR